ncbi:MAG: hypothetical protein ACOYNN_15830 [Terrimicrobiaceae bacterium]
MIRNTLIAALSVSLIVCVTLLMTREAPSPTTKPASTAHTLSPSSADTRANFSSPETSSPVPSQRPQASGTISANPPNSYPDAASSVSSGQASHPARSNPPTPAAISSGNRGIAQTAPPTSNAPAVTPPSATGVTMSLAPDGTVDIEIPPQAVVPAVLASDATQPAASATGSAPNSGSFTASPTTGGSPASAAAERIASDFLDNIQPAAGNGETSLEQWDNAAYLADESYRSLYGTDTYQAMKLKAAKENLTTQPASTP